MLLAYCSVTPNLTTVADANVGTERFTLTLIYDEPMLREYVAKAAGVTPDRPLLLDRFLQEALECEADALSDGKDVFIPAVMEHIELAGVHSGERGAHRLCDLPHRHTE